MKRFLIISLLITALLTLCACKSEEYGVGDSVFIGYIDYNVYEDDTPDESKRIEWIVLDNTGDELLLITKYPQGEMPFSTSNTDTVWRDSIARTMLNGDFYEFCFPLDERNNIVSGLNDNPDYATDDYVFLLSCEEASEYFKNDNARRFVDESGNGVSWWLRTSGIDSRHAMLVNPDVSISVDGAPVTDNHYLRPAIRIKING